MAPNIDITKFTRAHGKRPSGIGQWAFEIKSKSDQKTVFSKSMTFQEAKEWVLKEVKGTNVQSIYLLS